MLNPDLRGLLKDNLSRYSLVIAAARRARVIVEDQEANARYKGEKPSEEKPLSLAINELLSGEVVIAEPEEIRNL